MTELSLNNMRSGRPMLYYDELSPMSRSCLMLIELAGLDVDTRFIDLTYGDNFCEEFLSINPTLTVPVLVHEDQVLIGSTILIYLCDCTCSKVAKELYPNDTRTRMQILNKLFFESSMLARRHSDIMTELMGRPCVDVDIQQHSKKVYHMYDVLESYLRSLTYMISDSVTIADIAILGTLLGLDLIFPIMSLQNYWPKLSKWITNVSRLRGYSHIQKGVDRQRGVVEAAGQFQFANLKMSPDQQKGYASNRDNTRDHKEPILSFGNSKRPSTSDNMIGEQMTLAKQSNSRENPRLQNGVMVIPPMALPKEKLITVNEFPSHNLAMNEQEQSCCCECNCPYLQEQQLQQQQQSCSIRPIIANGNKPKSCNCVRIFENVGCDTTLSSIPSTRDQNMNCKKNITTLSEVSVIPVTEIPCNNSCDCCDCTFAPLPTDRPLLPSNKSPMSERKINALDQQSISGPEALPFSKSIQVCDGSCQNCDCNPPNKLCAVVAPDAICMQQPARQGIESPPETISSELLQRIQKQTAYNTDQNSMPLSPGQLNANSDSILSFNTHLAYVSQNKMGRQDRPCRKQVSPMSADAMSNSCSMYANERQPFTCPMRAHNRTDDAMFFNFNMPSNVQSELTSMDCPYSLGNDPGSMRLGRSSIPSNFTSIYPMASDILVNGRNFSLRRSTAAEGYYKSQALYGCPQTATDENTPQYNCTIPDSLACHNASRVATYANQMLQNADYCPMVVKAHDELPQHFDSHDGNSNMLAEPDCCAAQMRTPTRNVYPTDYNHCICNRTAASSTRKYTQKSAPPPPPSSLNRKEKANACAKNDDNLANSEAQLKKSTLIVLNDSTIDQIKPSRDNSLKTDEQTAVSASDSDESKLSTKKYKSKKSIDICPLANKSTEYAAPQEQTEQIEERRSSVPHVPGNKRGSSCSKRHSLDVRRRSSGYPLQPSK